MDVVEGEMDGAFVDLRRGVGVAVADGAAWSLGLAAGSLSGPVPYVMKT